MKKNDGKLSNEEKTFNLPDITVGLIVSFVSTGFFVLIFAICLFTKTIVLQMENAFWFFVFIFALSLLTGTLVFGSFIKTNNSEVKSIESAIDKICKGQYEIRIPEVSDKYKSVRKNILKLADYMKAAENANNDFINDFSHELKTPIVSIRGFAKLLLKGNLSKEEEEEYLKVIATESDRLIDLTAGTLLLDRLDNNRAKVEEKLYNLSEQLRRCILMLQDSWEKKNIDISADFLEYFVVSNEELVSQMFINVLQNAVKFSSEGGKVTVSVTETDKNITVLISDNGVGMDEDTKKRMFDKYFRGDKSRSTPGNGLGLATVKKIAEVLDITLKVNSKESVGTDFYIIFKK